MSDAPHDPHGSNGSLEHRGTAAPVCKLVREACVLLRDDERIEISPRSYAVLLSLHGRAPEVVTTTELLQAFWRGEISSRNAVHKAISELRAAFGDRPGAPSAIETVPKRGYRLRVPLVGDASPTVVVRGAASAGGALRERGNAAAGDVTRAELHEALRDALVHALQRTAQLNALPSQLAADYEVDFVFAGQDDKGEVGGGEQRETSASVLVRVTQASNSAIVHSERLAAADAASQPQLERFAQDTAALLRIRLNPERMAEMQQHGTTNVRAYLAWLEADYLYTLTNPGALVRAAEHLRNCIRIDPGFLRAYTRLATVLQFARRVGAIPSDRAVTEIDGLCGALAERAPDSRELLMVRATRNAVDGQASGQEQGLFELLKAGGASPTVFIAYGRLLATARLADAAADYIGHAQRLQPAAHIWDRQAPSFELIRSNVEVSLQCRRAYLAHDPGDTGHLSAMAMHVATLGRRGEAELYLRQLRRFDKPNVWSRTTDYFVRAALGDLVPGTPAFGAFLDDKRWRGLVQGQVLFIHGDVDGGVRNWQQMTGNELGVLSLNLTGMEFMFAPGVLEDERYQALLDRLCLGRGWRNYLRKRVAELQPHTGLCGPDARIYEGFPGRDAEQRTP